MTVMEVRSQSGRSLIAHLHTEERRVEVVSKFHRQILESGGVNIPNYAQPLYGHRAIIMPSQKSFYDAFRTFYVQSRRLKVIAPKSVAEKENIGPAKDRSEGSSSPLASRK